MHYFYSMQKNLQQLDLFGMPVEPAIPAAKKKAVVKEQSAPSVEQENIPEPEPTPVILAVADETPSVQPDPVVFADERIVVKIKAKPSAPVHEQPIQETTLAIAKVTPTNISKQPSKRGRKSFREIDTEIDLIDIPEEEVLKQKLYYSISEVAGWFKVNTSLLRYWENEFDILQPRKTRKGDRLFRVEDIRNLQLIYFLLRQRKFSIEGARSYLKQNKNQADVQLQLVQSLTKFRSFLLELKAGLGN